MNRESPSSITDKLTENGEVNLCWDGILWGSNYL